LNENDCKIILEKIIIILGNLKFNKN